ncbi:hypothetical protein N6B72_01045 [Chryseobacterium soli]|uniref:hypothetical protein n=1 Tax=Chryseobacterium soli TaxID=445961 RepID=UPI002952AF1E|nr:hypothetical protein [Chryseobacterium soli]MDV7695492.1 hypothetical protein [Chryseobacterium soli]
MKKKLIISSCLILLFINVTAHYNSSDKEVNRTEYSINNENKTGENLKPNTNKIKNNTIHSVSKSKDSLTKTLHQSEKKEQNKHPKSPPEPDEEVYAADVDMFIPVLLAIAVAFIIYFSMFKKTNHKD